MCTAQAVLVLSPALASAAPAASAAPSPAPSVADLAAAHGTTPVVTLVTGDKVTATKAADGSLSPQLRDSSGRLTGFEMNHEGSDTYVYPYSALPYVAAGLLDKELFNVTKLLADGYDDAHRDQLPLIVTYSDAAARARTQSVPRGARKVRTLDSIQGAALNADHSNAFWSSLTGSEGTAARSAGSGPALKDGIAKVWLDGKVKAALADSTAQIGAPEVWKSGNTGKGVDVAVLDTGIDTTHPDLAGQIAASEDFVPHTTIEDIVGHGTHVASTIAGTGAASDGKEQGVAPGVRLHVGKVLDDDGNGTESSVLAGMEWAARDQHAKIISMSLGGDATDGTDPLSQAVNELSAETGALFVIAAGNAGPTPYSVGAPGAADAALTVGAVDSSDSVADFSSRGPRAGDGAVKPDLTAPGVDILAARSQHALEGSGWYTTMSGTSMATPHVAGAAALLAAQHPDWTGKQLKDALVSTTEPTPQYSPYEGGSGRVDIAATTAATVFATSSADFGYHSWPTPAGATEDRKVVYTNTGDSPVTLDLAAATAGGGPADLFSLSAPQVTVPAHGTASVTATAHFDSAPADKVFAGTVTATDASGTVRARTSVSAGKAGERHHLTVKATNRDGKPLSGTLIVRSKDIWNPVLLDPATGTADLQLPVGSYSVWLTADIEGAHGPHSLGLGLLAATDITLDQDRTLVLDAARAHRITSRTPKQSTPEQSRFEIYRSFGENNWAASTQWPPSQYDSIWALPVRNKVTEGEFDLGTRWRMVQPTLTMASGRQVYDDLLAHQGAIPLPKGPHRLDAVFAGQGGADTYTSLNARGKAVVVRRNDTVPVEDQAAAAAAAGAGLLVVVNDGTGRLDPWWDSPWIKTDPPPVAVASLTLDEGERLITRLGHEQVRLDVTSNPVPEYLYDVVHDYRGTVPADLAYRVPQKSLARVDVSFRNFRQGKAIEDRDDVSFTGPSSLNSSPAPAIGERTEWVTAGEQWTDRARIPSELDEYGTPVTYRPGQTREVHWFGPIQRPRHLDGDAVVRQDDTLVSFVPGWGDSGTGHMGGTLGNFDVENLLKLYQGDTLVDETNRYEMWMTTTGLSPERLPYRLVSENNRDAWPAPYSTSTRTEWGFTSGAGAAGQAVQLPLIQLDYAVDTDVAGTAKRNTGLTVIASHLASSVDTGAIGKVTLQVSYDDGATWHDAALRHAGDGWRTRLDAPRGAKFVTLRATARDTRGNTVDQRITRAFGLR